MDPPGTFDDGSQIDSQIASQSDQVHPTPPAQNASQCWLCLNSTHEEAVKMHAFMMKNITSISSDCMADMISQHLQCVDPNAAGTCKPCIQRHIQGGHLLSPSLQMAHTLRTLFELRDTIHGMIMTEDENGTRTVDARNMNNYLKVVSEIVQVYKSGDVNKMMFAGEDR